MSKVTCVAYQKLATVDACDASPECALGGGDMDEITHHDLVCQIMEAISGIDEFFCDQLNLILVPQRTSLLSGSLVTP